MGLLHKTFLIIVVMKTSLIIAIIASLAISCSPGFKYRDISEFRMDTAALHEGEPIQVLYFSGGPGFNLDREFLYHYIVISRETGDTVNVFSSGNLGLKNDGAMDFIRYERYSDTIGIKPGYKNLWATDIRKVIVNQENLIPAENHFKSIIGSLGEVTSLAKDSSSYRLADTIHY